MAEEIRPEHIQPETRRALARSRKKLFLTVISVSVACTLITFAAQTMGDDSASTYLSLAVSDALGVTTSGSALALSLGVIYRQKLKGLLPKMYASLGLALGLWFAAEVIWAYYEVGVAIETPFPSIADAFWLAGYAPFVYFLIGILKHFVGISRSILLPLLPIASIGLILIGNILFSVYQSADLTSQDGIMAYVIGSAYPIVDIFLIIPAIAAFVQVRKGRLTFTPWVLIVAATVILTVADIGFAYSALNEELDDLVWVWNPLYNASYVAIASALFWHKSFFTVDEKKLMQRWQEKNR
jgi:hypothetical protein